MPVWVWVVGALVFVVVLLRVSMSSFRAGVREQLRTWLAQHRPEWRIEAESERQLVLQVPGVGPVTSPLLQLYRAVAANKTEPAEKQFEIFASALVEGAQSLGKPDPANLRPRLVPTAKLSSFPAGTPSTPIGETGLAAVYVMAPVPKDWAALAKATTPAGETLLLRPLRVSSAGIAAV
jgi:hypothetical protein